MIHDVERLSVGIEPRQRAATDDEVDLLGVIDDGGVGSGGTRRRPQHRAVARRERAEHQLDRPPDDVGVDSAGDGDHGVTGAVMVGMKAPDLVGDERAHCRPLAGRVAPQRMGLEDLPRELAVHDIVRRVVVHRQLLEDHLPLTLDVGVAERWCTQHVAEQFDPLDCMTSRQPAEERRVLLRGERVDVATDAIDSARDLLRRAIGRALEQQMLEEVADA